MSFLQFGGTFLGGWENYHLCSGFRVQCLLKLGGFRGEKGVLT